MHVAVYIYMAYAACTGTITYRRVESAEEQRTRVEQEARSREFQAYIHGKNAGILLSQQLLTNRLKTAGVNFFHFFCFEIALMTDPSSDIYIDIYIKHPKDRYNNKLNPVIYTDVQVVVSDMQRWVNQFIKRAQKHTMQFRNKIFRLTGYICNNCFSLSLSLSPSTLIGLITLITASLMSRCGHIRDLIGSGGRVCGDYGYFSGKFVVYLVCG